MSSPGPPGSTRRGARLVDEAKRALPAAAVAAAGDEHAFALAGQVGEQSPGVLGIVGLLVDQRAQRHSQLEIAAGLAGAVRAHAVLAAPGVELRMEPVTDQGVGVRAGDDEDRSAGTAVAAARTAARDELLAAKRQAAVSAVAGDDVNVDFVNEHNREIGELVIR